MNIEQSILSDITIFLKYAKYMPELTRRETWEELVSRNKNMHIKKLAYLDKDKKEDEPKFIDEITKAYKLVYDKKILPSMRSLQFAGKPIEINNSRIYNCCYLPIDDYRSFSEIMFLLLGGVGVGYSVQTHHIDKLPEIKIPNKSKRYLIGDSIEGWADAVKALMKAYLGGSFLPLFDFRDIRPKGARLVTVGGKAPGPEPLKECLFQVQKILDRKKTGEKLTALECHDIICHIADAVLSGGIRRAALIALFNLNDEEMLTCKFGKWYEQNPQRGRANNSAVILRHKITKDEFLKLWKKVELSKSGEPGIYFSNDKDWGTNPCCEVALRPYQFCNLCEINANDLESQEDLNERARVAAFIGTIQASYTDFHYLRDIWRKNTEKDALIGVGITGIASGRILDLDLKQAAKIVKEENARVAEILGINKAARTGVIKPAGTTSLVLGCSSGIHGWHDEYYIRRIRLGKNESLYTHLQIHHPELVEDDFFKPTIQAIVSVPQKAPEGSIFRSEDVMDLLERVKKFNMDWVREGHRRGENTNNVSATISIKNEEWEQVGEWMWNNKNHYNGLSVLPYEDHTYIQSPFETIDKETFYKMFLSLNSIDLTKVVEIDDNTSLTENVACSGNSCELV